jgi:type IV secretion system protein TrbL
MQDIPLTTGILTTVLNSFIQVFTGGYSQILPDAMHLLGLLATLEVAIAALWWCLCEENTIVELLKKIMKIGFFIFVVTNYQTLIGSIIDGFVYIGFKAGGAGQSSMPLLKDPSAIIKLGFDWAQSLDDAITFYNPLNMPKILLAGLAELLMILAFFGLAIAVFITYLEFYLIAVLGLILIPFGAFKHTAFLAEKVFGAIISFGVRLMVMSFILSTATPILTRIRIPPDPTYFQMLTLVLITATIAGLSWHASSVAGGLLSGSPSLSAGIVTSPVLAVGAGVVGAAMAIKSGFSATQAAAGAGGATPAGPASVPAPTAAATKI